MVKGNAQRRVELAERRKLESFEEKERRLLGPSAATPAEVRARLLSDARGGEEGLVAWVVTEGKLFCESWFRTGACPLKRCKCAHDETIAHLSGVPATAAAVATPASRLTVPAPTKRSDGGRSVSPGRRARTQSTDGGEGGEGGARSGGVVGVGGSGGGGGAAAAAAAAAVAADFPALASMPLRACDAGGVSVYDRTIRTQVRTESPLRFIAWGPRLVWDYANASVFAGYCEGARAARERDAAREAFAAASVSVSAAAGAIGGGVGGGGIEAAVPEGVDGGGVRSPGAAHSAVEEPSLLTKLSLSEAAQSPRRGRQGERGVVRFSA